MEHKISYLEFLSKMTDLELLAEYPIVGEKCCESSAYNKLSRYNSETGYYENWGQNWDEGYDAPRSEDGGYIIADMKGPGAVVRIWSADPRHGHIKIFIDGSDIPVIDIPFIELFGTGRFPFNLSELCYDASRGKNCFIPITYSKSCKIILYDDWGMFYQVNYISFSLDTKVEQFKMPIFPENAAGLIAVNKKLQKCYISNNIQDYDMQSIRIPAGGCAELLLSDGTGAITEIKIKPILSQICGVDWNALSEMTLSIYWDGEDKPSVWTTLGGFFGSITGLNNYKSLPTGVIDGTMYSNWYMPYSNGAKILVSNDSQQEYIICFQIKSVPLEYDKAENLLRFHAKWNRAKDSSNDPSNDRWPDSEFFYAEGIGRYVGTSLHIYKEIGTGDPAHEPGWWWGEGDEKFFVDGEKFPSWFGTGSEDYFGYAWGSWKTFSRPYHSQPFTNGGMFGIGNRLNNRFHIIDNVPFIKSFSANLEKYHRDRYANWVFTTFCYLDKNASDNYMPVSLEKRTSYYTKPYPDPALRYEGEDVKIIESTGMLKAETQDMSSFSGFSWSNDKQLIFSAEGTGDYVKFYINIEKSGDYEMKACFTKASDYGIVQHYIDGVPLGIPMDMYADNVVIRTEEISIGCISLDAGLHEVEVYCIGKNNSSKGFLYGLDYIIYSVL